MKAKDRIKQRYEELRKSRTHFHVEEWDLDVYVFPLTVGDASKLSDLAEKTSVDSLVDVLIVRACDSQGNKLFEESDRQELVDTLDPQTLGEVVEKLVTDVQEQFSERDLKNS